MAIFGRVHASCDMSGSRRVLILPVLGEASGENIRYIAESIAIGCRGSQMVIPEVTWDDGWYAICGS